MLTVSVCAGAQSVKIVIDKEGMPSRYLGETKDKYHVEVQDDAWISKDGCRVEIWSPEMGKGCLSPKKSPGTVNIRQRPDAKSPIVAKMVAVEYELPDLGECMGKTGNWYKVSYAGKTGYVLADLVVWDPLCI